MTSYNLLLISGSLRVDSFNRKLAREAAKAFGDANATEADIKLPLYNGDDEDAHGVPEAVKTLAQQIKETDALVISAPEYNKGISGALKNALDWVSRVDMTVFQHKPTVVMSAAAGRTGGETGLFMTMSCLSQMQVRLIFGPGVMVADASSHFDNNGNLITHAYKDALAARMQILRDTLS